MSALAYSYPEPYKVPAGVLALAVHGLFFALLYFGVNWHTEPSQGMTVDIWDSLPAPQQAPVKPELAPPPKPVEPELKEPPAPAKPDIALPQKKIVKAPEPAKPVDVRPSPQDKKKQELQAAQAEQERARAEQAAAAAAAIANEIGKYKGLIVAKIRARIVMPPDVPDSAQAEFDVVLLPGGSVLSSKLVKSSGNKAYDDAVERAIAKAQPLPLPPNMALFNRFRELHLIFTPKSN